MSVTRTTTNLPPPSTNETTNSTSFNSTVEAGNATTSLTSFSTTELLLSTLMKTTASGKARQTQRSVTTTRPTVTVTKGVQTTAKGKYQTRPPRNPASKVTDSKVMAIEAVVAPGTQAATSWPAHAIQVYKIFFPEPMLGTGVSF